MLKNLKMIKVFKKDLYHKYKIITSKINIITYYLKDIIIQSRIKLVLLILLLLKNNNT